MIPKKQIAINNLIKLALSPMIKETKIDNNNKKVYGVNFGIEPRPDDENYHYDKSECSMFQNGNDFYPTFISNIGGLYNKNKKSIENLEFSRCVKFNN